MTAEAFAPFGEVMEAKARPAEHREFFPITCDVDGRPTLDVIWQPFAGRRFVELERHFNITQTFVQLEGSPSVVAVAAPTGPDDVPRPEDVGPFSSIRPRATPTRPGRGTRSIGTCSSRRAGASSS